MGGARATKMTIGGRRGEKVGPIRGKIEKKVEVKIIEIKFNVEKN